MKTILITGATGFLGSHIAEELVNQGYEVFALKRNTSYLGRCDNFRHQIHWIDCDSWIEAEPEIIKCNPEILIHAAWDGVRASDRDNWIIQEKNLLLLVSIFEILKKTKISKIIALGSQAEYGYFEGSVDEDYTCKPNSAYSASKVCASILLKTFAEQNKIDWYWIRIFSVFGPREEKNWLIPTVINNLLKKKEIALTPCEQRYDYLFIKDFAAGILSVVKNDNKIPGIYNMSSGNSIKIKDILTFLETKLSPHKNLLQIGVLPYRPNQVMHMQGKSDRFFQSFNFKPTVSLQKGLEETIKYYTNKKIDD
jgi:nucleoside-diphosphate-sugar epimerase